VQRGNYPKRKQNPQPKENKRKKYQQVSFASPRERERERERERDKVDLHVSYLPQLTTLLPSPPHNKNTYTHTRKYVPTVALSPTQTPTKTQAFFFFLSRCLLRQQQQRSRLYNNEQGKKQNKKKTKKKKKKKKIDNSNDDAHFEIMKTIKKMRWKKDSLAHYEQQESRCRGERERETEGGVGRPGGETKAWFSVRGLVENFILK
jgi:predicted HTH transcriptional regulator